MKSKTLYKLTDENMRTYCGFAWELNKTYETSGAGDLCGPGWLHAYEDPLLAVLMNPVHAQFTAPRLFKARGSGAFKNDHGLKCGVTKLRLIKELPLPVVTTTQRTAFGILCAMEVCDNKAWRAWADGWLSGVDRSRVAASEAASEAAGEAAGEAGAAARAAYAAEYAEYAEYASHAAPYAAEYAAEYAARAAARAAVARAAKKPLNPKALAEKAMRITG